MNNFSNYTTHANINGNKVPLLTWQTHYTSYGNLCTFEAKTSIKALKQIGYNIFDDQVQTPDLECQIILNNRTSGSSGLVFDGIVDTVEGNWEEDLVEIAGRDFSAILRDTNDTLDKYLNQTVTQVIQAIAQQYGLQTNIATVDQKTGIRSSTYQGEDWAFSAHPQPTWQLMQDLATEADMVLFIDSHKVLNLQSPGKGSNHSFIWRPNQQQGTNPVKDLSILQQSRRCQNFTLMLHGYDASAKQTISYQKVVGQGGQIIHKHRQDLNSQNCQQIADALAAEIQRKNLVVKFKVDGDLGINLNDTVAINEGESGDLLGLAAQSLFIVSVMHSFGDAEYGSIEGDGFWTHITCNQKISS